MYLLILSILSSLTLYFLLILEHRYNSCFIGGRKRRGRQRMRWLRFNTNSSHQPWPALPGFSAQSNSILNVLSPVAQPGVLCESRHPMPHVCSPTLPFRPKLNLDVVWALTLAIFHLPLRPVLATCFCPWYQLLPKSFRLDTLVPCAVLFSP